MIKIKRKVATLEENIYPPHSIFNNERKLTLQTIKETIWPVVSFSYEENDELIFT